MTTVHLLDYGAGNVRSVRNAIKACGYEVVDVSHPSQLDKVDILIFPGVGSFGAAMNHLESKGFVEPLKDYISSNRHFLGICLGMQVFFESSEESPGISGLGIVKGSITKFNNFDGSVKVPSIGWNGVITTKPSPVLSSITDLSKVYFVHSFHASANDQNLDWVLSTTNYGNISYVSAIGKGNVYATQFHPEKSGVTGLGIIKNFLDHAASHKLKLEFPLSESTTKGNTPLTNATITSNTTKLTIKTTQMAKRVIACLDVRSNDAGDLVVTKGDSYDVREESGSKEIRNLGKPVELAKRYYDEGADEITFLNITSFRSNVLSDFPMLSLLSLASEQIFVPLTVGGGIRDFLNEKNEIIFSALDVASAYFRAGADKISIGSDAVLAVETYINNGKIKSGLTPIEQISHVYGAQAVVISVDPRKVYVSSPSDCPKHHVIKAGEVGPLGEEYCWYQCTIKGGRESRDIDAWQLCTCCEELGAGEILLNCINQDGKNNGYDIALIDDISKAVSIPVIASSGAGKVEHFSQVFRSTKCEAALAAGIFHRKEVSIDDVKRHLMEEGIVSRL